MKNYDRCSVYYINAFNGVIRWRLQVGDDVIGKAEGYASLTGAKIAAKKLGYAAKIVCY